jgi:anaerobic ribonucleoside-triphosphate reductase activating protein
MNTLNESLNIAEYWVGTNCLGPGHRSVVWVQGCPFHCHGCISPQWIPKQTTRLISIDYLIKILLSDPNVDGFTFSGGEPFLQAFALAELIRRARTHRKLNLICFSGYKLDDIKDYDDSAGVQTLLSQIDVLIDGQFEISKNDNRGLRGSSNQQIHHLTNELINFDFENQPRNIDIRVRDGELFFIGVPPKGLISTVNQKLSRLPQTVKETYERA